MGFFRESKVTVLSCSNPDCKVTFDVPKSECKADGVHSLHAAMQAHQQGWKASEGKMLCPQCARAALSMV